MQKSFNLYGAENHLSNRGEAPFAKQHKHKRVSRKFEKKIFGTNFRMSRQNTFRGQLRLEVRV